MFSSNVQHSKGSIDIKRSVGYMCLVTKSLKIYNLCFHLLKISISYRHRERLLLSYCYLGNRD